MADAKFWAIFTLLLVAVVGGGYAYWAGTNKQTALVEETKIGGETVAPISKGDAATLAYTTWDREQTPNAQVAVNTYLWRKDKDASGNAVWSILTPSTGTNSSTTTDATKSVSVGDEIQAVAFHTSQWYGKVQNVIVTSTTPRFELDVYHTINATPGVTFYDDNDQPFAGNLNNLNFSLAAAGKTTLNKIRVKNNRTDVAFNFYAVSFDMVPGAQNVSSITIGGTDKAGALLDDGTMPQRLAGNADKYFHLASPILLHENDQLDINTVVFESNGNACATVANNGENITVSFIDANNFVNKNNQLALGVENDATPRADVGSADYTRTLRCTA